MSNFDPRELAGFVEKERARIAKADQDQEIALRTERHDQDELWQRGADMRAFLRRVYNWADRNKVPFDTECRESKKGILGYRYKLIPAWNIYDTTELVKATMETRHDYVRGKRVSIMVDGRADISAWKGEIVTLDRAADYIVKNNYDRDSGHDNIMQQVARLVVASGVDFE